MRADRLIQIILLLQKRHTLSARELAEELCVSRRTIFRDMDTLGMMGIPVYAEQGAEGGYRLIEEYRTGLNGLTRDELSALLAFDYPDFMADLEIGQKIKTALLKLYATTRARPQKIYLDWTPWGYGYKPVPHLQTLYQAIDQSRRIHIHYRLWRDMDIERDVAPYGLVAKAGEWYVVYAANDCVRHQRASDLIEVRLLNSPFDYPPEFNLEDYWKAANNSFEADAETFKTTVRLSPVVLRWPPHFLGQDIPIPDDCETDSEGWITLELRFDSFETARRQILALGGGIEVIEPMALRLSVQDFAQQILKVYER